VKLSSLISVYFSRRKSSIYRTRISETRLFRRLYTSLVYDTLSKAPITSRLSIDTTRGLFSIYIVYTYSVNRSSIVFIDRFPLTLIYIFKRSVYFLLIKRRRLAIIISNPLSRYLVIRSIYKPINLYNYFFPIFLELSSSLPSIRLNKSLNLNILKISA
jgi:hypothetical protein